VCVGTLVRASKFEPFKING